MATLSAPRRVIGFLSTSAVRWPLSKRAGRWLGAERCEDCGDIRVSYNSCRNRHCPKCQGLVRAQWLADRRAELLPVPYFHVVFTVPAPIAVIALQNKAPVYDILFKAAAETIRVIGATRDIWAPRPA